DQATSHWEIARKNLIAFVDGRFDNVFFGLGSFLPYYLMLLTTFITLLSGLRYLYSNYGLLLPPYQLARKKTIPGKVDGTR
ncbi:MAG: hypothetical protein HY042_06015, partial [Spirochaetia bacterium]|nr:hypothetical protein [Spirochaetia bacterium]